MKTRRVNARLEKSEWEALAKIAQHLHSDYSYALRLCIRSAYRTLLKNKTIKEQAA